MGKKAWLAPLEDHYYHRRMPRARCHLIFPFYFARWRSGLARLMLGTLLLALTVSGCTRESDARHTATAQPLRSINAFERYLSTDFAPADGFDFPVGNPDGQGDYTDLATGQRYHGWYIATHFAENYSLGIHTGED